MTSKGGSAAFRERLLTEIIPAVETRMPGLAAPPPPEAVERDLVGISLAGLFALECAYSCGAFSGIGSVSGSLWYEGFLPWMEGREVDPAVKRMFFSVGEDEKRSRQERFSRIEDLTRQAQGHIAAKYGSRIRSAFETSPGGHFTDSAGRVRRAVEFLLG